MRSVEFNFLMMRKFKIQWLYSTEKVKVRLAELEIREDELYSDWKKERLSEEAYARNLKRLQAERLELEAKTTRRREILESCGWLKKRK